MYSSNGGMNELSCRIVIVLSAVRPAVGATAAPAPPAAAIFRKSRRDLPLISPSVIFAGDPVRPGARSAADRIAFAAASEAAGRYCDDPEDRPGPGPAAGQGKADARQE